MNVRHPNKLHKTNKYPYKFWQSENIARETYDRSYKKAVLSQGNRANGAMQCVFFLTSDDSGLF